MSRQVATVADEARIATAYCALKFKPEGQSFESYVLDLRAKFPRNCEKPLGDIAWRQRVLGLEQDLAYLQMKYSQERIKMLSSYNRDVAVISTSKLPAPINKKKMKRKPHPNAVSKIELEAVLSGMNHNDLPSISAPMSVLSSFDSLKNLTECAGDEEALPTLLLAAATDRALGDLSVLLRTVLPPRPCTSASVKILQVVSTLLSYLLTAILPLFISRLKSKRNLTSQNPSVVSTMDETLGQLTALIFLPIVRSFWPLSQTYTANVFSGEHAAADSGIVGTPDIRLDLCWLLSKAMSDLDLLGPLAAAHSLRGVRERVALEAVREIERSSRPRTQVTHASGTQQTSIRSDRIDTLARKDALWYSCSILHISFTPFSASSVSHLTSKTSQNGHEDILAATCQNKLLEAAILTGLSNIIEQHPVHRCFTSPSQKENTGTNGRYTGESDSICGDAENGKLYVKCHHKKAMDKVGRGMILGAIERAWLYLLADD